MSGTKCGVNLRESDYEIILDKEELLTDRHMEEFGKLLQRESNNAFIMQDTLFVNQDLLVYITPIRVGEKHIQIIFCGSNTEGHWICTYYDGVRLYIFDSLNRGCLNKDQFNYLIRLYPFKPAVVFLTVDQQPMGSVDCGVYSIAFATSIFFNIMPNTVNYINEEYEMRPQLKDMFKSNELKEFLGVRVSNNRYSIVENNWDRLFENRSKELKYGKTNFYNFSQISQTSPWNDVNEVLPVKPLEAKCVLNESNGKRNLRITNDNVNRVLLLTELSKMEGSERTEEKKIIRKENERLRKRNRREAEREIERKEREKKELANKREKFLSVTDAEKKNCEKQNFSCKNRKGKNKMLETSRVVEVGDVDERKVVEKEDFRIKCIQNEVTGKKELLKKKDAERKKKARQEETEEQKIIRRENDRLRKRNKREAETEVEEKQRKKKDLTYKKTKLSSETEEQKIIRRENDRLRKRSKREAETEVEKKQRQNTDLISKRRKLTLENEVERKKRLQENLTCKNRMKSSTLLETLGVAIIPLEDFDESKVAENYLGLMNEKCKFCGAYHFLCERPPDKLFNSCCHKGKVKLNDLNPYPIYLKNLLFDSGSEGKNFRENIRAYNSSAAFASMGAKLEIPKGRGPYVFRIHGQVYHNTYALHPDDGDNRKYGQLYILDTNEAVLQRKNNKFNDKCEISIMIEIDNLLRAINPYADAFKMMREVELEEEVRAKLKNESPRDIKMWIKRDRSLNQKTYNAPSCNEVAVIFVSEDGEPPIERDICIYPKIANNPNDGEKINSIPISILSQNVDPMIYPLMFPSGDQGWTVNMRQTVGNHNVTLLQFYNYRSAYRGMFNPCLNMGKLSQQYFVDACSKVIGGRINYVYEHQKELRVEMYCGLMDYLHNKAKEENVHPGRITILPSTFTGGPRSYQQSFMDAMRIVQEFGKPDLFITMTCNTNCPEITENLLKGEVASDRPDIVARVFQQKVKALMSELKDKQIFGPILAYVYVIEFQKRGLPHVHLIIFLDKSFAIRDAETVDKIICAEIPDEKKYPELYQIVKQFQVHGPCGKQNMNSPCMNSETKTCMKQYPKPFCSKTNYDSKNYPEYRRRNDGKKIIFYKKNGSIKSIADNSMIVPYNPYLSKKFKCHINVVACGSIGGIKYLFKYCYKGHDCAIVGIKDNNSKVMHYDEPQHYLNTRYMCPPEAMHRLYEFKMHEQSHAPYRLAVHLPDHQTICFEEGLEQKAIENFKNTTLTAWFELNKEDPEARKYLYSEIPHHYVFVAQSKTWTKRKRITKPLISRMYFVSPKDIERYYLRILLLYVRGAKSFEDIKTYEGITYKTFVETARARNLMIDDNEWDNCLTEAVGMKFPKELCRLFAYICVFGLPANAIDLWTKYKEYMIFDNNLPEEVSIQKSLIIINEVLNFHGFTLHQFGLPKINQKLIENYNFVDVESNVLSLKLLKEEADELIESLNNEQRHVFDDVMRAVYDDDNNNRYIFVDGPGGSGKSYLHNTIITTVESKGLIVLSVAWTGIAANLLKGGRTAHSMFKFPIPINENSTCNISGMSKQAELLKSAKIIIWDEISMAPKYALQAMESMLRDVTKCNKPFGGKVILLSGDFRQTLPIVPHGNRTHIVEVCVKNSKLWDYFQTRSLHANVRLDNNQVEFSKWLLNVGNGKPESLFEKENDVLEIPQDIISNGNLIDEIYGSSINPNDSSVYSSCILSLTNSEVLDMNERILSVLEGKEIVYYSNDSHVDNDDPKDINNIVPVEFLNSLTPDGLPPHKLPLKVGCIIMLLRNMNLVQGLCNGTRLVVKSLLVNVISAEIITGKHKGEIVFIPRIDLSPSQDVLPFKMVRRQFPVRLAYAMTINKSQGQSFDKVGIFLPISAFGHGQIYVGCSRVKSKERLKIHAVNCALLKNLEFPQKVYVKNIVYHEIL